MSDVAYPIGSVRRSGNLWESLPRETGLMPDDKPLNLFIGCFWALVTEIGAGFIVWFLWEVCR